MTRSEFKIEMMMKQCNIGRKTAISYLESVYWIYLDAVREFRTDSKAVEKGILTWKHPITE